VLQGAGEETSEDAFLTEEVVDALSSGELLLNALDGGNGGFYYLSFAQNNGNVLRADEGLERAHKPTGIAMRLI